MTGAIEFLRKLNAICNSKSSCKGCPSESFCVIEPSLEKHESDLVRKVMEYRLEDKDAERN